MLVNMLSEHGQPLEAGAVVLSGAITAAIAVQAGDNVLVRGDGIGTVAMRFI
jgi:2-oxo-3-hexenedioate decarboxylase